MDLSWIHFSSPTKVHFENNSIYKVGSWVKSLGDRVLIIAHPDEMRNEEEFIALRNSLEKETKGSIVYDDFRGIPSTEDLDSASYFVRKSHANVIVAYGSLYSFWVAKVLAFLATNPVFSSEVFSEVNPPFLKYPPLPVATVPVEFSLGEEITPFSWCFYPAKGRMAFFSDIRAMPSACFLDPELMKDLSPEEAALKAAGISVYCIESLLSTKGNPVTSTLALKALDLVKRYLPEFYLQGEKKEEAKIQLFWASIMSGIAVSNTSLGPCSAISMVLSLESGVDFFSLIPVILPHVMEYYLTVVPAKYVTIARSLGEDVKDISVIEAAIKAVEAIRRLFLEIKLPVRLSELQIKKHIFPSVAEIAASFPFLENSPRKLSKTEIEAILVASY